VQGFSATPGDAGLDATLNSINIQTSADLGIFTAQLSAQLGL
jgi:hypothetical protein